MGDAGACQTSNKKDYDEEVDDKAPAALDEGDIALLKTYGLGPYTTSIKNIEKEINEAKVWSGLLDCWTWLDWVDDFRCGGGGGLDGVSMGMGSFILPPSSFWIGWVLIDRWLIFRCGVCMHVYARAGGWLCVSPPWRCMYVPRPTK